MNAARQAGHRPPGPPVAAMGCVLGGGPTPGVTGGRFTEFPNRPLFMSRTEKGADRDSEKGEGKEGEGDEDDDGEVRVRS
jgi:hypothetical protein